MCSLVAHAMQSMSFWRFRAQEFARHTGSATIPGVDGKIPALRMAGEVADLVEVADVDGDGDVGRIAVVEEMLEADLHGDGADELSEARHLEIFHAPNLEHEGTKLFADEG